MNSSITSNKRNLKEGKGANKQQGQITKENGNSAIQYVTIIDLTADLNPDKRTLETWTTVCCHGRLSE